MINDLLKKIKEAIYGEEVRNSIHDAIEQCYKDATGHPESVAATVKEIGEVSANLSKETTDRKAEVSTERKRIDNLIATGTAQTQEIGKKIIQDSSISSSGIVLKGLTNNNYYYKLFEESGSIDSEFCTITNQQGKYTAKLLKPGLYYMNFKVHVEMSGGFSEEVIASLKLFKSNTLDWSTFDVLDAETVEISKTENTSINKKIHFLFRVAEPSYIRIYIDIDTSHTKTITFRIDGCDIIALDWKGKQSANLSELHDLRIGADGVVHNTAGEAVRKQIGNLTKDLNATNISVYSLDSELMQTCDPTDKTIEVDISPITKYEAQYAKYYEGKKVTLNSTDSRICYKFPVTPGKTYSIIGLYFNNTWTSLCVFSDSENNGLSEVYDTTISSWTNKPMTVTAPSGSAFVYVNGSNEKSDTLKNIIPRVIENKTIQISKEFKYSKTIKQHNDYIKQLKKNNMTVTMRDIKDSKISQLKARGTTILSFSELSPGDYFELSTDIINISKQMLKPSALVPNDYNGKFSQIDADINISTKTNCKYGLWYFLDREYTRDVYCTKITYTTTDGVSATDKLVMDFGNPGGMIYVPLISIPLGKTIKHIKMSIHFNSNTIPPMYIDSIVENRKLNPFIVFTTDNGGRNFYDVMKPIADKYGLKITTSTAPKDMDVSEVEKSIQDGHEFAIYGLGSELNNKSDFDDFVSDDSNFLTIKNAMESMIKTNFTNGVTYPCAYFCRHNLITKPLKKACSELGIYCLRGESGAATLGKIGNFQNSIATIGLIDSNLDDIKSYIDNAITYGLGISIFTHQIVKEADSTSLNTLDTVFEDFCKYVNQKIDRGELESINIKQMVDRFDDTGISKVDVQRMIHS